MQLHTSSGLAAGIGDQTKRMITTKGAQAAWSQTERLLDRNLDFMQLPGMAREFVDFYANDPVLMTLEIDVATRVSAAMRAFWSSICSSTPCGVSMFCCLPNLVYHLTCYGAYEAKVAAGHRLTLREKTLLLEVDPYHQPCVSQTVAAGELWPNPVCFCGGCPCGEGCGTPVAPKPIVIRLVELQQIQVMGGPADDCGRVMAPEHLLVTGSSNKPTSFNSIWGGIGMSVQADEMSVAGPKNAEEFIQAVLAQRDVVLQQELDTAVPPKPLSMFEQLGAQAAACGMTSGQVVGWGTPLPKHAPPPQQQMYRAEESGGDITENLEKLARMKREGLLTSEQFEKAKEKRLNSI